MLRGQEGANDVELKDTQSEQRAPTGTAQRIVNLQAARTGISSRQQGINLSTLRV